MTRFLVAFPNFRFRNRKSGAALCEVVPLRAFTTHRQLKTFGDVIAATDERTLHSVGKREGCDDGSEVFVEHGVREREDSGEEKLGGMRSVDAIGEQFGETRAL